MTPTAHGGDSLTATTDYADALDTEVTSLALATPFKDNGSVNTSIIKVTAETLVATLKAKTNDHVVVTKSTVTP
jgi:UDPglucose 6-dehydrogenase